MVGPTLVANMLTPRLDGTGEDADATVVFASWSTVPGTSVAGGEGTTTSPMNIFGLPSNQSLERTRWARSIRFAGRQWRGAPDPLAVTRLSCRMNFG
jgi:hypothetical protein